MRRLHILESALADIFRPARAARKPDKAYAKFRAELKKRGVTYKIASDGFIEFSDGVCFGHYGDWAETLSGYLAGGAGR